MWLHDIMFIHSSADGHLGCLHFGAIKNNDTLNVCVQACVYICFHFSWSGIARSYGNSMFNILKTCQTVFQSGCTILHSHEQCTRAPISPHPWQLLWFFKIHLEQETHLFSQFVDLTMCQSLCLVIYMLSCLIFKTPWETNIFFFSQMRWSRIRI